MKQKNKIMVVATIAILSPTMVATNQRCNFNSKSTHSQGNSKPQSSHRVVTPPPSVKCQISQMLPMENDLSDTQKEPISVIDAEPPIAESIPTETAPTQPTGKEILNTTPIPNTQTATRPTTPPPTEPATPQMGDTRIVDAKQQSYFLGFGWVDYMGENECIFEEGMYENGNKVGIMGGTTIGSDGDINKHVGSMD